MYSVLNTVAPYRYLLLTVYLLSADIANPDLFVYCRTWICLDITGFYEEQCYPFSGHHDRFSPKMVNRAPIATGFDTICTPVCHTELQLIVGCVDWSHTFSSDLVHTSLLISGCAILPNKIQVFCICWLEAYCDSSACFYLFWVQYVCVCRTHPYWSSIFCY